MQKHDIIGFDAIVTNPPFAGDVAAADYAADYTTARDGQDRVEKDVLFLERCINLLRKNGRLAIVLPDNKVSAKKFAGLRSWIIHNHKIIAVVSLHGYTFKPHTSQKAVVVFLQKGAPDNARDIRFYRSDVPGKTSTGELIFEQGKVVHDLDEIAADLKEAWSP